jgi:Ras-related protein Rab-5C
MRPAGTLPEFKAIVVGDASVGKTSLILRFHRDVFQPDHQPTVGGSFITKTVETPLGPAALNIWDTAGQERYRSLVPMYCRGASVALIVFDLALAESFQCLDSWMLQVRSTASGECAVIVVGNKLDLPQAVAAERLQEWFARQRVPYFAVSALSGAGVPDLLAEVTKSLVKRLGKPTEELLPGEPRGRCC